MQSANQRVAIGFVSAAAAALLALAGCGKKEDAGGSTQETTPITKSSDPAAEGSKGADGKMDPPQVAIGAERTVTFSGATTKLADTPEYAVSVKVPDSATAGTPSNALVILHPKTGWKLNEEFPYSLVVTPPAGVKVYVHDSLYDRFVEKSAALVAKYKLGNPLDEETTLGPMASKRFADEVRGQVADAKAAGAKALIDPAGFPADTGQDAYLAPQILVDVDHSMRVMTEESFGPVVGIMPVKDDEQALALMNDCRYGLTASVWTADTDKAAEIGARIETGTVFQNRCDYLDPALCWTGCKETGRGAALSNLGYLSLTRPKSYHLRKL